MGAPQTVQPARGALHAVSPINRLPRAHDVELVHERLDLLLVLRSHGSQSAESALSLMPFAWWFAAGVPAVASWTRGVETVLRDGVDGRLVPEGNRNQAATVLMRICDQPDLLASTGDAAAARWHAAGSTSGQ